MRPTFWTAISGLLLMVTGFFVDQAKHMPPVLRIVAPQYVGANAAAQTLFTKKVLSNSDRGFMDLSELYISARLPHRPPAGVFPTSLTCEEAFSLLVEGSVNVVHVKWNTGEETAWNKQDLQKNLDSLLENSISFWKFVLFPLGFLVACVAIFFEHGLLVIRDDAPEEKDNSQAKTKGSEPLHHD